MITRVAVGSMNPVKIEAVALVIRSIWPEADCLGTHVDSGVSAQPLTDEEAILGATNRARLSCIALDANLGIGLEGNTIDTDYGMFLSAWVAVVERGREKEAAAGLGCSGRLLLPPAVAAQVRAGAELGPLMDQVVGETNTKQKQGAVGILTAGHIKREEGLMRAVIFALAPWLSPELYGSGEAKKLVSPSTPLRTSISAKSVGDV